MIQVNTSMALPGTTEFFAEAKRIGILRDISARKHLRAQNQIMTHLNGLAMSDNVVGGNGAGL